MQWFHWKKCKKTVEILSGYFVLPEHRGQCKGAVFYDESVFLLDVSPETTETLKVRIVAPGIGAGIETAVLSSP